MDFHVFDTYVKAKDGHTMHFDVVTDNSNVEKAISLQKNGSIQLEKKIPKLQLKNVNFVTHNLFQKILKLR